MVPSTYEDGTLYNVLPSGNKAPDETGNNNGYDQTRADFSFTRGSNLSATRIGSDGLIEKGRENLLPYSNDLNGSDWSATRLFSKTSGHSGYDGSNNAWLVIPNSSNNTHYINQVITSGNGVQTISVYTKAGGYDYFSIRDGSASDTYGIFDLATQTTSTSGSNAIESKMVSVGNNWYRCSLTLNRTAGGSNNLIFYVSNVYGNKPAYVGDEVSGVYFQDFQVEKGLVATDYIETGATTAKAGILEDMPRIDYTSGTGALLLEGLRTNSIIHSEYTDGSNWSNEGSISDEENTSETTSPEGLYNAVKLVSANATSEQWIQTTGVQTTNATDCTISCFVKKSDYDYFHIRFTGINGAFAAGSVWFNIADGSVGTKQTGISADIKDYGNGWYRISATKEATATTTAGIRFQLASSNNDYNVVGDGVKGTYIYGCQAEIGSHVSSYIPSYGSAVTRSADSCLDGGSAESINVTEGVLYAEVSAFSGTFRAISLSNNTNSNVVALLYRPTVNEIWMQVRSNGVETNIKIYNVNQLQNNKIAIKYKENDFALWVNGVKEGTNTSGSTPVSLDNIKFTRGDGGEVFTGNVKQVAVFNEALSDAELATLTTL